MPKVKQQTQAVHLWGTLLGRQPSQWVDSARDDGEGYCIVLTPVNSEELVQKHGESFLPPDAFIIWGK